MASEQFEIPKKLINKAADLVVWSKSEVSTYLYRPTYLQTIAPTQQLIVVAFSFILSAYCFNFYNHPALP